MVLLSAVDFRRPLLLAVAVRHMEAISATRESDYEYGGVVFVVQQGMERLCVVCGHGEWRDDASAVLYSWVLRSAVVISSTAFRTTARLTVALACSLGVLW